MRLRFPAVSLALVVLVACGGSPPPTPPPVTSALPPPPPPVAMVDAGAPEAPKAKPWPYASPVVVKSPKGMVVTDNAAATNVGKDVLASGGNAADAAVATAFALAVAYPTAGNIG